MDEGAGVVIVGGGQAGYQTAESLRQLGHTGAIALIAAEDFPPYQRPPLSKAYLLGDVDRHRLKFRTEAYYAEHGIDLRLGTEATGIDRAGKRLLLADGSSLAYRHLVLATGARVRLLPVPGAGLMGVHYLRSLADVEAIERRLAEVQHVAVIGAGFIGLEFAAVARKLDKRVTVLEAAPRVMARVVAPELSGFFDETHRAHGVDIRCDTGVVEIAGRDGQVTEVVCADGHCVPAGLVVVGIGVIPETGLADACGLTCADGIVVDGHGRTSDPAIFAAGDCTSYHHPFAGQRIRLESVQNAADQGRTVAAAIAGQPRPYDTVPWFWSDQYDVKLQMVGLSAGCDRVVLRGDRAGGKFSLFHYRAGVLRAVDSVNRPADHIQARKLLAAGLSPTPGQAGDAEFKLKDLVDAASA
ncbi:MAG: FAD-dependent oxidoreductase [Rhodospirillaceae bacterium]|nr:FAD-dependent oxidoreductase [Rhodospirillaceae bacterium]